MARHAGYIPEDYHRIKIVNDMSELLSMQWENANAILLPRSQNADFQELAPHFGAVAQLIAGNRQYGYRINSLEELEAYQAKASSWQQKLCFDYIISDVKNLENQCTATGWQLRSQDNKACPFHFDRNLYPHTIITTYFGRPTRWVQDEDIDFEKEKPKKDAPIYRFQPGDICKINNKGDPSFFHAASKGFRMTLIAR